MPMSSAQFEAPHRHGLGIPSGIVASESHLHQLGDLAVPDVIRMATVNPKALR